MNVHCPYCHNLLLGSGTIVRVGIGKHAHRRCHVRAENEERHFDDAPCVQCDERLSGCRCCPDCAARQHSDPKYCPTCEDYQITHCEPRTSVDEAVGHAISQEVLQ